MNGSVSAGEFPDIKIYKDDVKERLGEDECVIADSVYDDALVLNGLDMPDYMHYYSAVRAGHGMVNGKLKRFKVLTSLFRHYRWFHTLCFHAVGSITQTVINIEEPLFQLPW